MCEILWCAKCIIAPEHKESQFSTTLQGHEHSWYRKYDLNETCVDYNALRDDFLVEFHIPKFEQKSISVLKDIKQGMAEIIREYDAHLNSLLSNLSYEIHPS